MTNYNQDVFNGVLGQYGVRTIKLADNSELQCIVLTDASGNVIVPGGTAIPSAITSNRKTVTTAGTAVTLVASTTACSLIDITALSTNTGIICVGNSAVVAASGTRKGVALAPGDTYSLAIDDVVKIYIDSTVNGEGVSFNYSL